MAFIIVEFLDYPEDLEETRELGIIPKSWLSSEVEDRCQYLPFCRNQNKINNMVKNELKPDKNWQEHRVRVLGKAGI